MLQNLCTGAAILIGVAAGFNGLLMLELPAHWYLWVPGVTTTGPYNQHFIRDIGLIFGSWEPPSWSGPRNRNIGSSSGLCPHCGRALSPSSTFGKSRSASVHRRQLPLIFRRSRSALSLELF